MAALLRGACYPKRHTHTHTTRTPRVLHFSQLQINHPRIETIPFNSRNKWMLTIQKEHNKDAHFLLLKGAPEVVLRQCATAVQRSDPTRDAAVDKNRVLHTMEELAAKGERVIAVARRSLTPENIRALEAKEVAAADFLDGSLVLIGLLAMEDPPRQGVKEAVGLCRTAGVRVAMVTGDHSATGKGHCPANRPHHEGRRPHPSRLPPPRRTPPSPAPPLWFCRARTWTRSSP